MTPERTYINELKAILIQNGYAQSTKGCSKKELAHWDSYAASGRLPKVYREFLWAMGKTIEGTYMGSYLFYSEFLEQIQSEAKKLSSEAGCIIPSSAFFFATFDFVYYYYFMTMDNNPNPEVFLLSQRTKTPQLAFASLKHFFGNRYGDADCPEL